MDQWDSQDYHKHSPAQQRWGMELLDKIVLSEQEQVIDLGCGDGRITAEIASRVPLGSVLGIDKSEEMIRFAREHFPRERFPRLDFMVKDIANLNNFQEFDLAYSNAVLHWIPDHAHALKAIAEGLKIGGRIVAQMGGKGNASGILNVLDVIMHCNAWAAFFNDFSNPYTFYDDAEYRALLEATGFTVKRIELIPKQMVHDGQDGLAAWIRTTWLPYTRRIPENLQHKFIYEIVDAFISSQGLEKKGPLSVEMVRLEFEAVKEQ